MQQHWVVADLLVCLATTWQCWHTYMWAILWSCTLTRCAHMALQPLQQMCVHMQDTLWLRWHGHSHSPSTTTSWTQVFMCNQVMVLCQCMVPSQHEHASSCVSNSRTTWCSLMCIHVSHTSCFAASCYSGGDTCSHMIQTIVAQCSHTSHTILWYHGGVCTCSLTRHSMTLCRGDMDTHFTC